MESTSVVAVRNTLTLIRSRKYIPSVMIQLSLLDMKSAWLRFMAMTAKETYDNHYLLHS